MSGTRISEVQTVNADAGHRWDHPHGHEMGKQCER